MIIFDVRPHPLKFLLTYCFSLLLFTQVVAHEYYVTITQIDYNEQSQSLEISIKFFTDDLEYAMAQSKDGQKLFLGTEKEAPEADQSIFAYVQGRFQLDVDGTKVTLEWLGKEVELNETWIYLEVKNVASIEQLEISNELLTETFETQTNIIHVNVMGQKKSMLLRGIRTKDVLDFSPVAPK